MEKPIRYEVGQRWRSRYSPNTYRVIAVRRSDGLTKCVWESPAGDIEQNGWHGFDECTLVSSATPVTPPKPQAPATGTYAVACPKCEWSSDKWNNAEAALWALKWHDRDRHNAAPVYGRMVGEARAQDGTPLTALEAIQARKKPEPWVPSCDELFWIKDA